VSLEVTPKKEREGNGGKKPTEWPKSDGYSNQKRNFNHKSVVAEEPNRPGRVAPNGPCTHKTERGREQMKKSGGAFMCCIEKRGDNPKKSRLQTKERT